MRIKGRWFLALAVLSLPLLVVFNRVSASQDTKFRWDIVNVLDGITSGGTASALANDGSQITVTGSGTFLVGEREEVTGDGTWTTDTDSGTFEVTQLIRFDLAPGGFPPDTDDRIGDPADARAGLAVLRIKYSDGSRGILVVSCNLGSGPSVFEGITASKGFVDYWSRVAPAPGVEGNRTLFHVVHDDATPTFSNRTKN